MMVMIERCQTAIGRFSGFPAASLPRLRFDRRVAFKVLIRKDFLSRVETRKNFFPEFPGAAGKGRGRRYPALFRPSSGSAREPFTGLLPLRSPEQPRSRAGWR